MKLTFEKITLSGHILEHDITGKPIFYGVTSEPRRKKRVDKSPISSPEDNELKSAHRAKATVRRLVNSNAYKWNKPSGKPFTPIFATFTFKEDIRDVDKASIIFTSFIQRLNYFVSGGTKKHFLHYISVTEFQDKNRDGVIHFHVLLFNLRYIDKVYDEIKRVWKYGHVNIQSVKKIKDLGKYLVKYMIKSMRDGRLKGHKKYFASRGLYRPQVIYDSNTVDFIVGQLPQKAKISTASWENKYCKKITRTTYNLMEYPEAIDWVRHLVLK